MSKIIVWTDGAYSRKRGRGSWAALVMDGEDKKVYCGLSDSTTSVRMEMTAAIQALAKVPIGSEIELYSDSLLLVKCVVHKWQRHVNHDLWKQMDSVRHGKKIHWNWIKGHSGVEYNEFVDKVAGIMCKDVFDINKMDKLMDNKIVYEVVYV